MVFPATELPWRVRIAPGADPNLSPASWSSIWEDISVDVRKGFQGGIEFTEGRGTQDTEVDTSVMLMTLDNRAHGDGRVAGRYFAGNPLSPYRLTRNTPVMAGLLLATDTFEGRTYSPGWGYPSNPEFPDTYWSHGSPTRFSVAGGVGLHSATTSDNILFRARLVGGDAYNTLGRATYSTSAVSVGGDMVVGAQVRYTDFSSYYLLHLDFQPGGTLGLKISRVRDGVYSDLAVGSLGFSYAADQQITLAWQVVGPHLAVKAWRAGTDPEPDTWDLTHQDDQVLEGAGINLTYWRTSANTNPGTITVSTYSVEIEHVEFAGFVRNWPVRWDPRASSNTFVPIRATGILGRVRQSDRGGKIIKSPLLRQLSSYTPFLYLPLEDEEGAKRPANLAQGGRGGYFDNMSVGNSSDLPGATKVVSFSSETSRLRGYPRTDLSRGTGFSAMWLMKFNSLPSAATDMIVIATDTFSRVDRWVIRFDGASINVRGFRASDGTELVPDSPILYGLDPTKWFAVEFKNETSGSNLLWRIMWTQVGTNGYYQNSGAYGTNPYAPRVTSIAFNAASAVTGAQFSHVWVGPNTLPFFSQTFVNVWGGYPGEVADARFRRILGEAGISGGTEPGAVERMGPQQIDSAIPILRTTEAAEHGVIYESGWGLTLRPRERRYERPVTLTLDASAGGISVAPEGDYDDQRLVNDATGNRANGAQGYRWSDEEHVAREGRYPKPFTWNLEKDESVLNHLSWEVFLGTQPGYSWPRISLNLTRNPTFANAWRGRAFGARLKVINMPGEVGGQEPDVIVEGSTTRWNHNLWEVDANCSDARPWAAPGFDDEDLRFDSDLTTLDSSLNSSALTFSATVQEGERWITDPAEFPLSATIYVPDEVTGEEVTVTGISGTSMTQTWTLGPATIDGVSRPARAVNGVSMPHAAGARVGLTRPAHFVL